MCSDADKGKDQPFLGRQMAIAGLRKKMAKVDQDVLEVRALLLKVLGEDPQIDVFPDKESAKGESGQRREIFTEYGARESKIRIMELRMKCLEMAERNSSMFVPKFSSRDAEIMAKSKAFYDFLNTGEAGDISKCMLCKSK